MKKKILNGYLCTGTAIWHPRCGPGPTDNGTIINGGEEVSSPHKEVNGHREMNGHDEILKGSEKDIDGLSSTASEGQVCTCYFHRYFPKIYYIS